MLFKNIKLKYKLFSLLTGILGKLKFLVTMSSPSAENYLYLNTLQWKR